MKTLSKILTLSAVLLAFSFSANAQSTDLTVSNESSCEVLVKAGAWNCNTNCLTAVYCVAPGTSITISACGTPGNHYEWHWAGVGPSEDCTSCDPVYLYDLSSPFLSCTTPTGPFQITIPPCASECFQSLVAEFVSADHLLIH